MAGVNPAHLGGGARQGNDLIRFGVHVGGVDQAGGKAPGPRLHGRAHLVLHGGQLFGGGSGVGHAHHLFAHGAVPHQGHHVQGGSLPAQRV